MNTWINFRGLSFIIASTLSTIHSANADVLNSQPNSQSHPKLAQLWQLNNFDQPESVVANPGEKAIYISNINGQPTELNGKGYISKVSMNGEILTKHWLDNLDAPKGMAIHGDNLYIADMQQVHQVSISQARIVNQFEVKQAKMLNDITIADDGSVYISDLLAGGIYRIKDNQISPWFAHKDLPHPNGLLWQHGELLVASWGLGMNDDFTTKTAGSIYKLNIKNPQLIVLKGSENLGNLDGLVASNKAIYVSDWISGDLFKIENDKSQKILILKPGLADIGNAGSVLFTPFMLDGQVSAWEL
jgi:DNA-binding beta-propeller fold protein YncE